MINHIYYILCKDLLEVLRNKRAFISGLLLPALFIPFIIYFQSMISNEKVPQTVNIAIYDYRLKQKEKLFKEFFQTEDIKIHYFKGQSQSQKAIAFDLNIIVHDTYSDSNYIKVFFDSQNESSLTAYHYFTDYFIRVSNPKLNIISSDLSKETQKTHAPPYQSPLSDFPWIFLMFSFSGAAFVATEIITGEKERHTLESLISLQIQRSDILISKFLTIFLFSAFNFIFNVMILGISNIFFNPQYINHIFSDILSLFIILFPSLLLLSAILLHIAVHSRTTHESKSMESVFFLFFSILMIACSYIKLPDELFVIAFPFVNTIYLIKNSLSLDYQIILYYISYFSLFVFLMHINFKFIKKDEFLKVSYESRMQFDKKNVMIIVICLLVYFSMMFFGQKWINEDYIQGIIKSQLFIFFIPAIIGIFLFQKRKDIVYLKKGISFSDTLMIFIITCLLFVCINYIHNYFIRIFVTLPSGGTGNLVFKELTLFQNIMLLCLIPALCEEFFFRGFLLNSLCDLSESKKIMISAIIFTVFHQNALEFFGLLILGLWFSYLVVKTKSIWPAILAHLINNSLVLILHHYHINLLSNVLIVLCSFSFLLVFFNLFHKKKRETFQPLSS